MFALILLIAAGFMLTKILARHKKLGGAETACLTLVFSAVFLFAAGLLLSFFHMLNLLLPFVALLTVALVLYIKGVKGLAPDCGFETIDLFLLAVFVIGFLIRAYPTLTDPMPYGSYDVIQHYAMSMEVASHNGLVDDFPRYINWYGNGQDNVNGTWIYPPGTSVAMASAHELSGLSWSRTINLFGAFFDSLTILVIFLICLEIFDNKKVGIIAGFFFAVSTRNLSSLYFGQVAYELGIMLAMLSLYFFLLLCKNKNKIFTLLSGISAGMAFITSPLAMAYVFAMMFFFSVFKLLRRRDISAGKAFAAIVVIALLLSAFYLPKFLLWSSFFGQKYSEALSFSLIEFVYPEQLMKKSTGMPSWYYEPFKTLGAAWIILFLSGLALAIKNKYEWKSFLLVWVFTDYVLTHAYIVLGLLGLGVLYDYSGRFFAQSAIVYAVLAGVLAEFSLKLAGNKISFERDKKIISSNPTIISLFAIMFIAVFLIYVPEEITTAQQMYQPPWRINAAEYGALQAVAADTGTDYAMLVLSPNVQASDNFRGIFEAFGKTRVYTQPVADAEGGLQLLFAHKHTYGEIDYMTHYVMFDYTGFATQTSFKNYADSMQSFEAQFSNKLYDSGGVRVYKV